MKLRHVVLVAIIMCALVQAIYYYPRLPERIASHFDASGHPDGLGTRNEFFAVEGAVVAGMIVLVLFLEWLVPRMPASRVSLPNKDYWLAPERRAATDLTIQRWSATFLLLSLGFLVYVMQLALLVNVTGDNAYMFVPMWAGLGAFLLLATALSVKLIRQFRKPRE
jgi:uncharacterized membrane protein